MATGALRSLNVAENKSDGSRPQNMFEKKADMRFVRGIPTGGCDKIAEKDLLSCAATISMKTKLINCTERLQREYSLRWSYPMRVDVGRPRGRDEVIRPTVQLTPFATRCYKRNTAVLSAARRSGGCSSAGRAPDCGSGRRGFESRHPPQTTAEQYRGRAMGSAAQGTPEKRSASSVFEVCGSSLAKTSTRTLAGGFGG